MRLGSIIHAWRLSEKRSIRPLAKEIGIPHASLHRFENSKPVHGDALGKILAWSFDRKPKKAQTTEVEK